LLIEAGRVTPLQLKEALETQAEHGGKIVETLISLGHMEAHSFVSFLAKQPGVASIDLVNYEIPKDLVSLVPKEYALTAITRSPPFRRMVPYVGALKGF